MKKIILILIWIVLSIELSFAYQQQGFDNYNELNGYINFQCSTQCFILVGPVSQNDFVNLNGNLQGNGILGYGFLVGEQIYPGETIQINGGGNIDQKFTLSNSQAYSQIPGDSQLVIVFQGSLLGNQIGINGGFMGVFDKIGQGWNDFWTFDTYKPYTINFLYGPKVLGTSANKYIYRIFIIVFIIILFRFGLKNKKTTYYTLGLLSVLRLFYSLRMYTELYTYRNADYQSRVKPEFLQKTFRDDADLYQFIDFVKNNLSTGTACIHSAPYKSWDFDTKPKYHLYPQIDITTSDTGCKYILIYKEPSYIYSSSGKTLTKDGNIIATGEIYKTFNQTSFIFKKS